MIRRRDGWLTARVGGDLVMMSVGDNVYIGLNEIGARIWDLLETPRSLPDLCRVLMADYEVGADACQADVEAFLDDLERRGAISREA